MDQKNYFLPNPNSEEKSILQEAKIAFCDMEIEDERGIIFDQIPGCLVIKSEIKTPFEGIFKITLDIPSSDPTYKVETKEWEGGDQKRFIEVAEKFADQIHQDVIISVPHGHSSSINDEEKFWIKLWSSPFGEKTKVITPEKIWGIKVDCTDNPFSPTHTGEMIVDDNSWTVAELFSNSLYVHYDICHYGSENEKKIFQRVLEEVVILRSLTPEQRKERSGKIKSQRIKKSRDEYINECYKRTEKLVRETKKTITEGEKEIENLQKSLVKKIREVKGSKSKLEQIANNSTLQSEGFGKEFDKLSNIEKIIDLQVSEGVIKIFTDTLYCEDPRSHHIHEIGKFRIEIYTDGQNDGVRWFNLDRKVDGHKDGMNGPHIWLDGKACLGNTQEIFPELIANYEFSVVAMLAIQFVESVNVDDSAGKHISSWPIKILK